MALRRSCNAFSGALSRPTNFRPLSEFQKAKNGQNEWTKITPWKNKIDRPNYIDLIDSRNETKLVQDFDNCPVEENGRKIGIVDSAAQNLKT